MNRCLSILALLIVHSVVSAQSNDSANLTGSQPLLDSESERSLIQVERARLDSAYEQAERDCYDRFAVTNCLSRLRSQRRETLDKLRRKEVALNDAERMRKALEQVQRIQEKSAAPVSNKP